MIELIIAIAILAVLGAVSISTFFLLQKGADLSNAAQELVSVLKLAQNKTLASQDYSQYGVYFDTAVSPNKYTLFKGASFASRDVSADQNYLLPKSVELYDINLNGGNEVVFNRLVGSADNWGSVSLRLKDDISQNKIIYIANSGVIGFVLPSAPSDTRTKDSRHTHVDYNRNIDVNTESIILTFNETVVQQIPFVDNLSGGQFYWEGKVNVAGSDQTIKIHTHKLNNPDTQFSVHRDMRFNDANFEITISGDITGAIAEYSADGRTTSFSSIFVQNLLWQ